jgi:peptidoglycan/xylan/chitin deacetylase (PgdA/CDA1 family)
LTFDDGPTPFTGAILDILKAKDVKVTFFLVGARASQNPDLVAREAAEGHVVANHSYAHKSMLKVAPKAACEDVERSARAIRDAGAPRPSLVRPPYGSWNKEVLAACPGKTFVLWNVDTMDWSTKDVGKILEHIRKDVKPGSIVLMHDTVEAEITAIPQTIDTLRAAGYTLVTVPELFPGGLGPDQAIYSGPKPE